MYSTSAAGYCMQMVPLPRAQIHLALAQLHFPIWHSLYTSYFHFQIHTEGINLSVVLNNVSYIPIPQHNQNFLILLVT